MGRPIADWAVLLNGSEHIYGYVLPHGDIIVVDCIRLAVGGGGRLSFSRWVSLASPQTGMFL